MSTEIARESIIAPDRGILDEGLDTHRGSDIAMVAPVEVFEMLESTGVAIQMAVKGADRLSEGKVNFASSMKGAPKIVVVPPPSSGIPLVNTANQLVGTTWLYENKHGMLPNMLVLSPEAQARMELIADELAFRAFTMYTGSLSLPDVGADSRCVDLTLDDLTNKFDPAANMFSRRSFAKLEATGVSKEQLEFMEKRREWTQLLLADLTEKLAAQKVPGVQCYMNDRENDSPTIRVLFDRY